MRYASYGDLPSIRTALFRLQKRSPAVWMGATDLTTAMSYIAEAVNAQRVWFFGNYMVMVDVGSPWYSKRKFLLEELVLKVYEWDTTFTLQQVLHAGLDQLASHYGCEATVVGDTQIGYMTPLYIAAGYSPIGTQLFKERPHGMD